MSIVNTTNDGTMGAKKANMLDLPKKKQTDIQHSPSLIDHSVQSDKSNLLSTSTQVKRSTKIEEDTVKNQLSSQSQDDNLEDKSIVEKQASNEKMAGLQVSKEKSFPVVKDAIEKINAYMDSLERDLEFNFDEDAGRTIVKVINKSTNEVVRILPPEESIDIAERIASGNKDLGAIIDFKT